MHSQFIKGSGHIFLTDTPSQFLYVYKCRRLTDSWPWHSQTTALSFDNSEQNNTKEGMLLCSRKIFFQVLCRGYPGHRMVEVVAETFTTQARGCVSHTNPSLSAVNTVTYSIFCFRVSISSFNHSSWWLENIRRFWDVMVLLIVFPQCQFEFLPNSRMRARRKRGKWTVLKVTMLHCKLITLE